MNSQKTVGAGQLLLFLTFARVTVSLTHHLNTARHVIGQADWLAALLLPAVLAVLALPTAWLLRVGEGRTVCRAARLLGKGWGAVYAGAYALLFFVMAFAAVGRFSFFVTSTMQPDQSPWFFPALLLLPVCYAALKGLQAIMRAGAVLAVMGLVLVVFVLATLVPRMDLLNVYSPLYNGWGGLARSVAMVTANSGVGAVLLMVAPRVRGRWQRAYAGYALAAGVAVFGVAFTTLAVLGGFSGIQLFPFFTAAGVANVGELNNLSALYAAAWIWGVFVQAALYLELCWQCLSAFIPDRLRTAALVVLAALAAVCAGLITGSLPAARQSFQPVGLLVMHGVYMVVLPLVLAAGLQFKKRKEAAYAQLDASGG